VNDEHSICAVWVDETPDIRNALPTASSEQPDRIDVSQRFFLPVTLKPGTYTLCVSLGDTAGTPLLELPYQDLEKDSSPLHPQKRYPLGKLTVTP
jgi:hypothetical protein